MKPNSKKSIHDFFLSGIALLIVLVACAYWLFPEIAVRFRNQAPVELSLTRTELPKKKMAPLASPPVNIALVKSNDPIQKPKMRPRRSPKPKESMVQADEGESQERLDQAVNLVDSGNWAEALVVLDDLLKKDPGNHDALVELAMIHLIDRKDPSAAIPFMEKAIQAEPGKEDIVTELLSAQEEMGQPEEALKFLKQMAQEHPDSEAINFGMAQALLSNGQKEDAIDYLQRSIDSRDGYEKDELMEQMADTLAETGQGDQAIEVYRRSIERHASYLDTSPDDAEYVKERYIGLRLKYASALIRSGYSDDAESVIKELEGEIPDDDLLASLRALQNSAY